MPEQNNQNNNVGEQPLDTPTSGVDLSRPAFNATETPQNIPLKENLDRSLGQMPSVDDSAGPQPQSGAAGNGSYFNNEIVPPSNYEDKSPFQEMADKEVEQKRSPRLRLIIIIVVAVLIVGSAVGVAVMILGKNKKTEIETPSLTTDENTSDDSSESQEETITEEGNSEQTEEDNPVVDDFEEERLEKPAVEESKPVVPPAETPIITPAPEPQTPDTEGAVPGTG